MFGYAAYAGLYRLGCHYLVALTISQVVGVLNAYLCYKLFVFRTRGAWVREFVRFSAVSWAVFAANAAVLPALVRGLGWTPLVAQAVFTVVSVVALYLAHDGFSFATPGTIPAS